jgi:3-phenylpropionate/trans-cinnamate dioxygenase ferredoxin reductase subunit
MRKSCRVTVNDQVFSVSRGDVLLDAALKDGVDIPYDCRSGHCGICRVRVLDGLAVGGECREPGIVRACQSRIMSDLNLKIESLPNVQTVGGRVSAIKRRGPDVVELKIEPSEPLIYLPGQYLRVQFRGFPVRCYNPTASMEDLSDMEFLHLQVRRLPHGHVSAAIGSHIREGHKVRIRGPFGSAFLRPASQNRLVLIASGTGFAPVWSIAVAAIRENPRRRIVVVVGARTLQSLYMINALCMLARYPNVTIIPVIETSQAAPDVIRIGHAAEYIPDLSAEDSVHVCGPPQLVEVVSRVAAAADAPCYSVPFMPQHANQNIRESPQENRLSRALNWLNGAAQKTAGADDRRRHDDARRAEPQLRRSAM